VQKELGGTERSQEWGGVRELKGGPSYQGGFKLWVERVFTISTKCTQISNQGGEGGNRAHVGLDI